MVISIYALLIILARKFRNLAESQKNRNYIYSSQLFLSIMNNSISYIKICLTKQNLVNTFTMFSCINLFVLHTSINLSSCQNLLCKNLLTFYLCKMSYNYLVNNVCIINKSEFLICCAHIHMDNNLCMLDSNFLAPLTGKIVIYFKTRYGKQT